MFSMWGLRVSRLLNHRGVCGPKTVKHLSQLCREGQGNESQSRNDGISSFAKAMEDRDGIMEEPEVRDQRIGRAVSSFTYADGTYILLWVT